MVEILLANHSGISPTDFQRFLLNTSTETVSNDFAKDELSYNLGVSGTGNFVSLFPLPHKKIFAAIYVADKKVFLWLAGKTIEITHVISAHHHWIAPGVGSFEVFDGPKPIFKTFYFHFQIYSFPETDLLKDISETLGDPKKLKRFIFVFSGLKAGLSRKIPDEGLTDDFLNSISDPFT